MTETDLTETEKIKNGEEAALGIIGLWARGLGNPWVVLIYVLVLKCYIFFYMRLVYNCFFNKMPFIYIEKTNYKH